MIGTKFYKDTYDDTEYAEAAAWCNETQEGHIEDMGEYYEVVPNITTVEEARENKINQLKYHRDTEEVAPIQTDKGLFDYDDKARDRINAAIIALDDGGSISWTLADNTNISVTADDLRNVIAAAAVRSNQLHVTYRGLKADVMACTTNEEVEGIHWPEA